MEPLVRYLKANNLKQTLLARQLGVTDVTVSNIVKGKRKPGFALTAKIEEVTGIPRHALRPDIYPPSNSTRRR